MKINNITLITAAAALAPFALNAQSAPAGAPAASKQAEGIKVTLNDKATITVSGYAQAQYYYSDSKNNSGDANSGFSIRRAAISAKGKIGENWSAEVGFEIDGGKDGGKLDGAFVDKAIISYTSEYGKLTAGYQKTAFAMEEYSSSKTALAIEHGIATRYLTKGDYFASLTGRHGGIWWDGKFSDFKYTLAVANQYSEDFESDANSGVAFFGTLAYTIKSGDVKTEIGINGALNPGNDEETNGVFNTYEANVPAGLVWGLEPYVKVTAGGFTGILDVIYADGDEEKDAAGNRRGPKDSVWGGNATIAYRFDNDIEPVVRLSYVDVGDNKDLGPNLLQNVPKGTSDHDTAFGAYIGANYYVNKNIKVSAGYEYTTFDGGAKDEYANSFRLQLQAVF